MKNLSYLVLLFSVIILSSCSNKLSDNDLSGHLLMGPFATTAISGDLVNQKLQSLIDANDDDLIKGYKDIFALPYHSEAAQHAKVILLNDYNVTDKATTSVAIKKLLENSKSGNYKAYSYACAVNVANLAYASGYLIQKDVEVYEQKILAEATVNYNNWKKYLNDFLKGREIQLKDDPNNSQQQFEIIVNELLLKNENSPYLKLGFAV